VSAEWTTGEWAEGVVEWTEGDTAFISIVFSWHVDEALARTFWYRAAGYKVRVGGPGVFTAKRAAEFAGLARVGGSIPGVQTRHNPMATKASTGCSKDCFFCIVPAMEGPIELLPDFEPRPVLTDNNLSALPADYQQYIIARYREAGVPLLDANSGFEPETFDEEVYDRWEPINQGPWRFGLDETGETDEVDRVIRMLRRRGVSAKRIRPYVMIGHEPFDECMARLAKVFELGAEPYCQYIIKLNARRKEPWVQHDWTRQRLLDVQRWVNGYAWRKMPFAEYRANARTPDEPDERQRDFLFPVAA
jgi:hypothetical protein